jgi:hypothetical protein
VPGKSLVSQRIGKVPRAKINFGDFGVNQDLMTTVGLYRYSGAFGDDTTGL